MWGIVPIILVCEVIAAVIEAVIGAVVSILRMIGWVISVALSLLYVPVIAVMDFLSSLPDILKGMIVTLGKDPTNRE
jgi:hypothetical protein